MMRFIFIFYSVLYLLSSQIITQKEFNKYRDLFGDSSIIKPNDISVSISLLNRIHDGDLQSYLSIAPKLNLDISDNVSIRFKHNFISENKFYNPNPVVKDFYRLKEYSGFKSYTEEAYLNLKFKNIDFQLGRFIDKLGTSEFENLVISNNDFHDGYKFTIHYKNFKFSNRFYQLAPFKQNININRYFHQHGIDYKINEKWFISLNETSLYSILNGSPKFSYLNPFNVYHTIQLNTGFNSNTNFNFNIAHKTKDLNLWLEFLVDDFQVDSESESLNNQEPNQIGLIFGGKYKFKHHQLYMNLTYITNRTYNDNNMTNDSIVSYTKYIDHDKIIGYHLGNNLVNFEVIYQYELDKDLLISYYFNILQNGDEGVFSKFNSDFSKIPNYTEDFPFGNVMTSLNNMLRLDSVFNGFRWYISVGYYQENLSLYSGINIEI